MFAVSEGWLQAGARFSATPGWSNSVTAVL
jgi:hypothetical protein